MNINLHIERLVLDGVDLQPQQENALKAALEFTLSQQLISHGVGYQEQGGKNRSSVSGGSISLANSQNTESLAQHIAHAVYRGIGE